MHLRLIYAAALCVGLASPVMAETNNPHVDRIVSMLQSEGYHRIEIERTWLGRIRIEAEKGEQEREIVLNRSSGEILRDYIEASDFFSLDDDEFDDAEGEMEEDDLEEDEEDEDDEDGEDSDDD